MITAPETTITTDRFGDRWEDPLTGFPKSDYRWRVTVQFTEPVSANLLAQLRACMPTRQQSYRQAAGTWLWIFPRYQQLTRTCDAGQLWLGGRRSIHFEFGDQHYGEYHRNVLLRNLTDLLVNLQSCPQCGAVDGPSGSSAIPPEMPAEVEWTN